MNQPTSKAQKRVLEAVRNITTRERRGATLEEIAAECGKSVSTVHVHVTALAKTGLLDRRTKGVFPGAREVPIIQAEIEENLVASIIQEEVRRGHSLLFRRKVQSVIDAVMSRG